MMIKLKKEYIWKGRLCWQLLINISKMIMRS